MADTDSEGVIRIVAADWGLDVPNFLHEITKSDRIVLESMSKVVDLRDPPSPSLVSALIDQLLPPIGPVRNQAPPQSIQGALLGLRMKSDRENILCWRNVPTDRQIPLRWNRNMIPASKLFFCRGSSVSSAHWINSESGPPPGPTPSTMPEGVGVVAFAFCLDGRVTESAYRGAQDLDRLVPNPEGSCQSMFQNFALGIKSLLGRWRDGNASSLGKDQSKSLQDIPSA
jgi:hypothetical protein